MNNLTQTNLNKCFTQAKEEGAKYAGVLIRMAGYEKDEIIINPQENFTDKLAYYNNAYDEGLEHKHADGVKIIGFTYGDDFASIEKDLLG